VFRRRFRHIARVRCPGTKSDYGVAFNLCVAVEEPGMRRCGLVIQVSPFLRTTTGIHG